MGILFQRQAEPQKSSKHIEQTEYTFIVLATWEFDKPFPGKKWEKMREAICFGTLFTNNSFKIYAILLIFRLDETEQIC